MGQKRDREGGGHCTLFPPSWPFCPSAEPFTLGYGGGCPSGLHTPTDTPALMGCASNLMRARWRAEEKLSLCLALGHSRVNFNGSRGGQPAHHQVVSPGSLSNLSLLFTPISGVLGQTPTSLDCELAASSAASLLHPPPTPSHVAKKVPGCHSLKYNLHWLPDTHQTHFKLPGDLGTAHLRGLAPSPANCFLASCFPVLAPVFSEESASPILT